MKVGKRLPERRRGVVRRNGERIPQEQREEEEARMKRRVPKSLVQRVFDLCNEVFRGPGTIPYPQDSQKMKFILAWGLGETDVTCEEATPDSSFSTHVSLPVADCAALEHLSTATCNQDG